jgi:hypothetical protein
MTIHVPPEQRMWRTDKRGLAIYALISNDPRRPSEDDPMLGSMVSSIVAQDVISTHNGALARYGRRYGNVLASAEVREAAQVNEVYFQVSPGEKQQLLELVAWLNSGPYRELGVVEKLERVLQG